MASQRMKQVLFYCLLALFGFGTSLSCKPGDTRCGGASLQPLLAVGLEKVATHLQVSAQVARSVAETIPTLSVPGEGSGAASGGKDEQLATLLHLAYSVCRPWCAGIAVLVDHSAIPQWAGNWSPLLQKRAEGYLRYGNKHAQAKPEWQLLPGGETGALFVVPLSGGGVVAVAVDLESMEAGLEELDWRGGSFVVADAEGKIFAAVHTRPVMNDPEGVAEAVQACVSHGSQQSMVVRLADGDHVVASDRRTMQQLQLHGVLIMPWDGPPPSAAESSLSPGALALRVVGLLAALGVTGWLLWLLHRCGSEDALITEMQGHLDDKKRAEAANSAKSMFLANMSHELRTPMAAILLGLDLVLEADSLSKEQESSLLQVKHCASELLTLLNDILDLGKIESGKFRLEAVDFDLAHEIQSVVDMFGIQCAGKGIIIGLEVADEMERIVNGDPLRFRQILGNLISNSIKFTPPGGSIYVSARQSVLSSDSPTHPRSPAQPPASPDDTSWMQRASNWLQRRDSDVAEATQNEGMLRFEIEVNDTGCGLSPENREAVFETFTQADSSTTRMYGGTGLGLGITRKLVTMMGGTIGFVDKLGPGALVRVQLSLPPPVGPVSESPSHALLHAPVPELVQGAKIILAMPPHLSRRLAEKWLRERRFDYTLCSSVDELMSALSTDAGTPVSPLHVSDPSAPPSPATASDPPAASPVPPVVIIDFAMVQAAALQNPPDPKGLILSPTTHPHGARSPFAGPARPLLSVPPLGLPTVFDADSPDPEPEPVLGPVEVINAMARLKADMGANIVWLLDPNTPPAVRTNLVKSRGFALLVLRPLHAGRLSEIMRKVGTVRERRAQLKQARENMVGRPGSGTLHEATGQSPGENPGDLQPSPLPFPVAPSQSETSAVVNGSVKESASVRESSSASVESGERTRGKGQGRDRALAGLTILVVEDSPVLQKLVTSMLVRMGARVEQAGDGQQAVGTAAALRGSVDIILMDCQMPVLDGYSATQAIRAQEQSSGGRVPIIALTAHAMLSDEKKCLEAGMDAYLSKPVSPGKLCETILRLVKRELLGEPRPAQ